MRTVICFLMVTSLAGCVGMSFEQQMASVANRKRVAVAEIQRQQEIQRATVSDSHARWLISLTPQQRNEYEIAVSNHNASQVRQKAKILEGIGGMIQRLFGD